MRKLRDHDAPVERRDPTDAEFRVEAMREEVSGGPDSACCHLEVLMSHSG
jgi:hypothetical protein